MGGIGVHGWHGRWLVNGAASALVAVEVEAAGPGWAVGFPAGLRVSVEDPAGLVVAIGM